jgi:spore coat protein CotH
MIKKMIFMAALLTVAVACNRHPVNYPPDDTHVTLTSTNLPIVWIEVGGDTISRYERTGAHMKIIYNGEGQLNYADTVAHKGQRIDYEGEIALRYRGNSSFNISKKKPYSFRTLKHPYDKSSKKHKVKILGMGKDNNWALLAPYSDKSMIRDMLAFEVSRPWMEYTPQGRFCEVILDGTYYGVYILCEVVSKGRHRLDLQKPGRGGDAITGDYLMEVDYDDDVNYVSKFHPVSASGVPYKDKFIHFQYKSPDFDNLDDAQVKYINGRIDEMEQMLASAQFADPVNGYSKYIDVMSFIDYQIAMELSHNIDAYRKSAKFYKRRDSVDGRFKLVVWDNDLSYGNCRIRQAWRTDTWAYMNNDTLYRNNEDFLVPFWWYRLNSDEAYTAQLRARWAKYRQSNLREERLMAVIDSMTTVLTSHGAVQRDSQAWPHWGIYVWPIYYIAKDYDDEIAYLKQWIHRRIEWMDIQLEYAP